MGRCRDASPSAAAANASSSSMRALGPGGDAAAGPLIHCSIRLFLNCLGERPWRVHMASTNSCRP